VQTSSSNQIKTNFFSLPFTLKDLDELFQGKIICQKRGSLSTWFMEGERKDICFKFWGVLGNLKF